MTRLAPTKRIAAAAAWLLCLAALAAAETIPTEYEIVHREAPAAAATSE